MELARKVLCNHQCRRHPRDPDKHPEEGTYNTFNKTSERMLVIDNEVPDDDEQKSVQELNSKGESIDGTCKKKEDDQEDLSLFKLMDKIDGIKYSGADVKLNDKGNTGDQITVTAI